MLIVCGLCTPYTPYKEKPKVHFDAIVACVDVCSLTGGTVTETLKLNLPIQFRTRRSKALNMGVFVPPRMVIYTCVSPSDKQHTRWNSREGGARG